MLTTGDIIFPIMSVQKLANMPKKHGSNTPSNGMFEKILQKETQRQAKAAQSFQQDSSGIWHIDERR